MLVCNDKAPPPSFDSWPIEVPKLPPVQTEWETWCDWEREGGQECIQGEDSRLHFEGNRLQCIKKDKHGSSGCDNFEPKEVMCIQSVHTTIFMYYIYMGVVHFVLDGQLSRKYSLL